MTRSTYPNNPPKTISLSHRNDNFFIPGRSVAFPATDGNTQAARKGVTGDDTTIEYGILQSAAQMRETDTDLWYVYL